MWTLLFVLIGLGLAIERAYDGQKWQTIFTLLLTAYIAGGFVL